jgi:hypothetical protein
LGAVGLGRGLAVVLAVTPLGCVSDSVKISGTDRTGSEQLLLTGTADRAIGCLDFRPLAGARVYLDAEHVKAADADWIVFSLRRAMARQGVLLVREKGDAALIVEAAVGAYGTDQVDRRLSTPALVPTGFFGLTAGTTEPQAISRRNWQDAVAKLALVAFDAKSHRLVWESGTVLRAEWLDRQFLGVREVRRSTSLPELNRYPRRGAR